MFHTTTRFRLTFCGSLLSPLDRFYRFQVDFGFDGGFSDSGETHFYDIFVGPISLYRMSLPWIHTRTILLRPKVCVSKTPSFYRLSFFTENGFPTISPFLRFPVYITRRSVICWCCSLLGAGEDGGFVLAFLDDSINLKRYDCFLPWQLDG